MSNFVFYDFETSSSNKYWGQIIQIGAVLTNDKLEELDRFDSRCRLSPGIIPEAMALIVNKSSPKMLKNSNLSHYLLTILNQFLFRTFIHDILFNEQAHSNVTKKT